VRLAFVLVLALAVNASANGRPPLTNGVFFRPSDAQSIYVRTTFGLLISHDDGCSFRWVCERAIGYGGEFDPKYAIAADGTIFATTFTGLRVSRDGGCTWSMAPVGPGEIWVDAIDVAPNGDVWVATAESAASNNVYRSTDNGATFATRGMLSGQVWWKSVKVAPSNPQIVYVAGYQVSPAPTARLFRSEDGGETWTERPLFGEQRDPPTIKFGATPIVLVAAIDPNDPNIVLLTSIEANPPKGDRLYRSTDGGVTFTQVLATTDKIRDVLYALDGSVYVATLGNGGYRSVNRGVEFTPLADSPQLGCLGQRSDGALVGCGANWEPDFKAVARTTDATKWQKVFRFVELAGPVQCAAGTSVAAQCEPNWPSLKELFGATGPGTCPAVPDGAPKKPASSGGCCDAGGSSPSGLVLAGALALILRRRYKPSRQLL
jgi:hypothetical protein